MEKNDRNNKKLILETSFLESPFSGIGNYLSIYLKGSKNFEKVEHINCTKVYNYFKLSIVNDLAKKNRLIRILRDYFYRLFLLQIFLLKEKDFVFISPYHNLYLPISKKKYITTIHDLVFIEKPEYFTGIVFYINKFLLKWSIKNNLAIITVSLDTKKRIQKYCRPKQEIHHIYNSYPENYSNWIINKNINDNQDFLLYFGGVDPRKNIPQLFNIFKTYNKSHGGKLKLVCTKTKESYQQLKGVTHIPDEVVFLGEISNHELMNHISQSIGVIYLSEYEGFGRPIMEATAFGKPILVKNLAVYKEIEGAQLIIIEDEKSGIIALLELESMPKSQKCELDLKPKFIQTNNESTFIKIIEKYIISI